MRYGNDWVVKTLFIEIHRAIHGDSRGWGYYLSEPEELIRIIYPPGEGDKQI
jgi:hypothetical protein